MPGWVGGKYNGVCFYDLTEVGSASATITAAGKFTCKISVPSEDGKKALKLSCTAKGFNKFDENSNTLSGIATMRINRQTVDVTFELSVFNGEKMLTLSIGSQGITALMEQESGNISAGTIEVDGFTFKLSADGKVKWSGNVEGDNGRVLSVSGSSRLFTSQFLSGSSVLVYVPPKTNLVGGRCKLFHLW